MSTPDPQPGSGGSHRLDSHDDGVTPFEVTQATDEFQGLRRTLRRFVFPATIGFLVWYLLYVLLSGYARGFMGTKLFGNINVAYVFGILQFVSTFAIAYLYAKYAERHFDPTADRIRERLEAETAKAARR